MSRPLFESSMTPFGPVYPSGAGSKATDTSREAAAAVTPTLGDRQRIVLAALKHLGRATADELMRELDFTDPNKVRPRVSELLRLGLIRDAGERRLTPSGVSAIVWEPTR